MPHLIYLFIALFSFSALQAKENTTEKGAKESSKEAESSAKEEQAPAQEEETPAKDDNVDAKEPEAAPKEQTPTAPKEELNSEDLILKPYSDWKDQKPSYYRTPKGATKGITGLGFPYTLWYDHYNWHESEPLNEHAERSFRLGDDDNAFAIIVSSKNQIALVDLDDIVIKNAKESGFEHAKIASIERRNVNGNEIIYMHWKAILQGIHVDFLSYLYSDPRGSVFIHTYTPSNLYKDNQKDMELFLNGFTTEPLPKEEPKKKGKKKS